MNTKFKIHSLESAPSQVRPLLEATKKRLGFVPNLLGAMAESPETASAFMDLTVTTQKLSLLPDEREIAVLVISSQNHCEYCVAQHKLIAKRLKIDSQTISSIQLGSPISNSRHEAIRLFVADAMAHRGKVSAEIQYKFFSEGFTQAQALEIMFLIGAYTISNYSNGLMEVPIDDFFKG